MSANDTQVGGDHYKKFLIQHWDLAIAFDMAYMPGQISKYFDRHRRKKGAEDFDKGIHFMEKAVEWAPSDLASWTAPSRAQAALLAAYFAERRYLHHFEATLITDCALRSLTIPRILEHLPVFRELRIELYGEPKP